MGSAPDWGEVAGPLTRVPLRVRLSRSGSSPMTWQGRALADVPIVGVGLARFRDELQWSRTTKRGAWSDDLPGLHTGLWISAIRGNDLPGPATVQLQLPGVAPAWSTMAEPGTPIEVRESIDSMTGTAIRVVQVGAADPLDIAVLFLAREDVRGSRNGAWQAGAALAAELAEPWVDILAGPRCGTLRG